MTLARGFEPPAEQSLVQTPRNRGGRNHEFVQLARNGNRRLVAPGLPARKIPEGSRDLEEVALNLLDSPKRNAHFLLTDLDCAGDHVRYPVLPSNEDVRRHNRQHLFDLGLLECTPRSPQLLRLGGGEILRNLKIRRADRDASVELGAIASQHLLTFRSWPGQVQCPKPSCRYSLV